MILGGNIISKLDRKKNKTIIGNSKYYFYHHYRLKENEKITLSKNTNFTVYILDCGKNDYIKIENKLIKIKKNIFIYFKKYQVLENLNNCIEILLVGKKSTNIKNFILKKKSSNFYKVIKPWGNELWINSINNYFVFKKIFIKKDFKTSLQFHNIKRETNLILDGSAKLFYKKNNKIQNLKVLKKDIAFRKLKKNNIVNVYPKILHRIEALTNLLLFEVSSPHLKDVVRVADDTKRKSGHIKSEHSKNR